MSRLCMLTQHIQVINTGAEIFLSDAFSDANMPFGTFRIREWLGLCSAPLTNAKSTERH